MAIRGLIIAVETYSALTEGLAPVLPGTMMSAERFREWLVNEKGAAPSDVLFCTDDPDAPGRTGPATRSELFAAIRRLQQGGKDQTDELYVYLSGHGFGYSDIDGVRVADLFVCSDYRNRVESGDAVLRVDALQTYLRYCLGPGEHYYFVDCCRNSLSTAEIKAIDLLLPYDRSSLGQPTVYTLYSTQEWTSAGVASGFGDALLKGLQGTGRAKLWRGAEMAVVFQSLLSFVRAHLAAQPIDGRIEGDGEGVIVRISPAPNYRCTVRVADAAASDEFEVRVRTIRGQAVGGPTAFVGPLGGFDEVPDDYQVEVVHAGRSLVPAVQPADLYGDCEVIFRKPAPAAFRHTGAVRPPSPAAPAPIPTDTGELVPETKTVRKKEKASELVFLDLDMPTAGTGEAVPPPAPAPAGRNEAFGQGPPLLEVTAPPNGRVVVRRRGREPKTFDIAAGPPVVIPGVDRNEIFEIEVLDDEGVTFRREKLIVPGSEAGIPLRRDYSRPPESRLRRAISDRASGAVSARSPVAAPRAAPGVGAWARRVGDTFRGALARRGGGGGRGERAARTAAEPARAEPPAPADPGLDLRLALLGAARIAGGESGVPGGDTLPLQTFESFPAGSAPVYVLAGFDSPRQSVWVGISDGPMARWIRAAPVADVPDLFQALVPPEHPGDLVSLRINDGPVRTLATCRMANRVSFVTATHGDHGELRIQQFLLPMHHLLTQLPLPVQDRLRATDLQVVRHIVRATRQIEAHRSLTATMRPSELEELLYGKWLDPVMGVFATYELVRRGQGEQRDLLPIVLQNLRQFFPELPDVAALERMVGAGHEPVRKSPLLLDGFLALDPEARPDPLPADRLLYQGPWTSWINAVAPPG
jgi:hypothetical protein